MLHNLYRPQSGRTWFFIGVKLRKLVAVRDTPSSCGLNDQVTQPHTVRRSAVTHSGVKK